MFLPGVQLQSATAVRSIRPENGGVRPGFRVAPAISHRSGAVRSPVARWKGNVVSYTPVKSRRSQKQRLQHNSTSRAPLSPHEWDARLLCAARLVAQHMPARWFMAMADHLDKSVQHLTRHRASTHSSFSSSPADRHNHMEKGPNFTDGKHFHMVGACCSLMVQMLPSAMNLIPIPPRHLPERARDSFLPSRLLTEKRCSRQRVPASQQYFSSRSDGSRRIHRLVRAA